MKTKDTSGQKAPRHGGATDAGQAYAAIIDLILTHQLRLGERTSVVQLAERLGFGRTPVKEAITRLQAEGLLSVAERSGTTVNAITAESAKQVFALRRTLEAFAVEDAVRNVQPVEIQKLKAALAEMAQSDSGDFPQDAARFLRANVAFHSTIVAAAKNPVLDRLYAQIQIQAQIVTYLYHRGEDAKAAKARYTEHAKILKALVARDAPLLGRLLTEHAETTEQSVLRAVSQSPGAKPRALAPVETAPLQGKGVGSRASRKTG
jgi:DNA-binding GntR family transcriptional regulator